MKTIAIALTSLFLSTGIGATKKNTSIGITEPAFAKAYSEPDNNVIKVAILLDTSNSMDGLIDQAKSQLWELVNELSYARCGNDVKPTLQIALYEYGNDRLNAREGYIRQVSTFTNDLDDISGKLFGLTTNGGNEYCGKVIQTSLNQLDWGKRAQDLNLIFIAGNEPFDQGPVNYKNASSNACAKDVTVNTIFCGEYNEGARTYWKDGARLTQGDYIAINHDKQTVHVPSPYDDRILEKNKALNATYVRYGNQGRAKAAMQAEQDSNASAYGQANAVKRAVSKSSHFYKNSSWDLVDAVTEDDMELEEVAIESLPEELQGKTTKEIEAYVDTKRKERSQIQAEIASLNKKRLEYVSKKQNTSDNELRNAMVEAIKKQATKKEYTWE
jgi:hypothetical protein